MRARADSFADVGCLPVGPAVVEGLGGFLPDNNLNGQKIAKNKLLFHATTLRLPQMLPHRWK